MEDSLKIKYDETTGMLQLDWDREDPKWSFLNDLTSEEIQDMLGQAIEDQINGI